MTRTEIFMDAWESCPNCSARFWGMEKPVAWCMWCDCLDIEQQFDPEYVINQG